MSHIGPETHHLIIPGFIGRSTATRAHINGNATRSVLFLSLTSVLLQLGHSLQTVGLFTHPYYSVTPPPGALKVIDPTVAVSLSQHIQRTLN